MKKKSTTLIFILSCIVLMTGLGYIIIGNPFIFFNNQKLKSTIGTLDNGDTVSLNEIIPFEWDILYMPEPYQSKAEIEEMIGFKSSNIQENNINEGMVHLLFVKNSKVVANVIGYSSNLKYSIYLTPKESSKVTYAENAQFLVTKTGKITKLTYMLR